jgi:hypothetical protein
VVEAALDAGATHVSPILLHLRPGVREEFLPWLEANHPELVERYRRLYVRPYGPKEDRDRLGRQVGRLVAEASPSSREPPSSRFARRAPSEIPRAEQATLW